MTDLPAAAADLLNFWFADATTSQAAARRRIDLLFGYDPDFDAALTARYGDWPDRALAGEFRPWCATPRGALALAIVLDQLPRNIHRGSPRAYACDAAAQALAVEAVAADWPAQVHVMEAPYFYLPFEHAENLDLQHRCVAGYAREHARAPAEFAPILRDFMQAGREHREIIERFGRFPHRNPILGRASTPAELDHLANGGRHYHQQIRPPDQDA